MCLAPCQHHERGDFPGGPVVKTSPSNAEGMGSIPGQGAKIPHASQPKKQNIKQKQHYNKFNKDFEDGPHQNNLKKNTGIPNHIHMVTIKKIEKQNVLIRM